jgi:hypothetical protein
MVDSRSAGASSHHSGAALLPQHIMAMQVKTERLYLKILLLERDVVRLRAIQPVVMTRPRPSNLGTRIWRLVNPRARRRHQLTLIRNCGLFDANWYLRTYADVAKSALDPAEHFLRHGATDLRDPGPYFDTGHYLLLYPDIAENGMNPLVHYIVSGIDEGRATRPDMAQGQPLP